MPPRGLRSRQPRPEAAKASRAKFAGISSSCQWRVRQSRPCGSHIAPSGGVLSAEWSCRRWPQSPRRQCMGSDGGRAQWLQVATSSSASESTERGCCRRLRRRRRFVERSSSIRVALDPGRGNVASSACPNVALDPGRGRRKRGEGDPVGAPDARVLRPHGRALGGEGGGLTGEAPRGARVRARPHGEPGGPPRPASEVRGPLRSLLGPEGCWLPARRCGAGPETGQQVVGAIYHPLMALDSALMARDRGPGAAALRAPAAAPGPRGDPRPRLHALHGDARPRAAGSRPGGAARSR